LGRALWAENPRPKEINLFLTHFHWDHIQGLPFFAPLIQGGTCVRFHADPFFTLDLTDTKAARDYRQVNHAPVYCGDLAVEAFPLNHPQCAWGYRIESAGAVVVVATDVEHGHPILDKVLRERARNADLLIYDAQYTETEYATRVGWGHSTPEAAVAVAEDAQVKHLLLSHHDPEHDDGMMDEIVNQTRQKFQVSRDKRRRRGKNDFSGVKNERAASWRSGPDENALVTRSEMEAASVNERYRMPAKPVLKSDT
jgi:phosphoribosyl 1,2-cyclic phosphodiesterase